MCLRMLIELFIFRVVFSLFFFFFLQEKCLQEFTKKNEERKNRINEGDSPIILQIEGEIWVIKAVGGKK